MNGVVFDAGYRSNMTGFPEMPRRKRRFGPDLRQLWAGLVVGILIGMLTMLAISAQF
jgi:hypothetical protein